MILVILSQSFDEFTVELLFSVLANLVQEKPIGKITRIEETIDVFPILLSLSSRSHGQQSQLQPDDRESDNDHFIKHLDGSNGGQENKPEPESKVDFLIDDILGQNAEMIGVAFTACRSNFRHSAWDGSRENFAHWIQSRIIIIGQVLQDIRSISWEVSIEECTCHAKVGNQEDDVQDLAKQEFEVIELVVSFQHSEQRYVAFDQFPKIN